MASPASAAATTTLSVPIGWHDLASAAGGRLLPPNAWGRGDRLCTDTRELQQGDIFWALSGDTYDGHDFAADAVRAGAALVVCRQERAADINGPRLVVDDPQSALGRLARWQRTRHEALVIGVTGSVGKTTTKELIYAALSQQFSGLKSPGNFNNLIGVPKTLLQLTLDHEFAVCEFGASRTGDIRALAEIAVPEIGVITAIGTSHLESFGSREAIVRGKGELLEALPETGFCVLPGDSPVTRQMATLARCRALYVGEQDGNDVQAREIAVTDTGLTFSVDGTRFHVALPSRALLSNALCAIAVAREIGVPLDLIAEGLEEFRPLPGRGVVQTVGPWTVIDDCYNASPLSVEAALERLSRMPGRPGSRRYAVLGDMRELGVEAETEHRRVGEILARLSIDGLLAYGQHARDLADGAIRGGCQPGTIVATESLEILLTMLDCWLDEGDTLLVKGSRVMQMERVIHWLDQQAGMATDRRLRSA